MEVSTLDSPLDHDAFFHLFATLSVMALLVIAYSVWRAIRDTIRARKRQEEQYRRRRW